MAIHSTSTMDRPRSRPRLRRLAAPAAAVATLGLAAWAATGSPFATWLSTDTAIDRARVRIAPVVRGDLERSFAVQGRVVAAYHPTAFAPAPGTVALAVRPGDTVRVGDVLGRVESPELQAEWRQARSSLAALRAELERARIEARQTRLAEAQRVDLAELDLEAKRRGMQRAERSLHEGILNRVDYETAQDDLRRAELERDHARQNAELRSETLAFEVRNRELAREREEVATAELARQVEDLTIRAPVTGLVSKLHVEDRDAVVAGAPLATVVDLSEFEVELQIPESFAAEAGPGTPLEIPHDGRTWRGRVTVLSPEVEGGLVRAIARFDGESPEDLRQNQRLTARLILDRKRGVLKVARGPFLEHTGGRFAFVVEGDRALRRAVRIGTAGVSEVEVLEGLEEGDHIVVSDTNRFEDAQSVHLRP